MKDPETKDTYIIKLTGKAEIPEGLMIGNNYEVLSKGTITSITESDNDNGSHTLYHKFEPITSEIKSELGKAIKAKDSRRMSQLFRANSWKYWKNTETELEFNEWYEAFMINLIQAMEELVEMYRPNK